MSKITTRSYIVLATLFLSLAIGSNAQTTGFSYKIRPTPLSDRTELNISLSFQNKNSEPLTVKLPSDCFGTPDLSKYVSRFEGIAGTTVQDAESSTERRVKPNSDGTVSLRYTLSYDPKAMDASPYSPNTSAGHFHLAGCQYLLPIGDINQKVPYQIEIDGIPSGWKIYSTISANASKYSVQSSYDDLSSSAIGGGANGHIFNTKKGRVAVFAHGDLHIPRAKIYASIEQIIRAERAWFNDYEQPNYTIVLAPRSNVNAGYAPDNGFICFVDPKTKIEDLYVLVAHEFFHNWLPNKIEIIQDKKYSDVRLEWFSEGFTDYFARKILTEAKLMTADEIVTWVNQNTHNIADNPHRAKGYDELIDLGKTGKFDGVAKKLAYFRGALIALNWDAQIRRSRKDKDLGDLIRELYRLAAASKGNITEDTLVKIASENGVDAKGDIERYIMRGEPIVPDERAIPRYRLHLIEKPSFEIGFSLEETRKAKKVTAVNKNGPAYKAGLRDGMGFVSVENAYRFSNAWKPDLPLIVKVTINGEEKHVEYFPHGVSFKIAVFTRMEK
ncbi:MAG: hypothetical protein IPK01_05695 [Acidobacteria bacterium]|nr:hypothetical protein [Acidobacteriota bacterium]